MSERTRPVRIALLLTVPLGLWLGLALLDYGPRPVPFALLTVLAVLAFVAGSRATEVQELPWPSGRLRSDPGILGADQRLLRYLRAIESHRDARQIDTTMVRALAQLARNRLERRDVVLGDPLSRDLLGDDLVAALCDPAPVRLSLSDIDRCLQRIEAL